MRFKAIDRKQEQLFWKAAGAGAPLCGDRPAAATPGLSSCHKLSNTYAARGYEPGSFTLKSYKGGVSLRLSQVSAPRPAPSRGTRGEVCGMSSASRRRCLERANAIDRSCVLATDFLTMTVLKGDLDGSTSDGWSRMERARRHWEASWRREYGDKFFMLWRKELHKSGTLHLHAICFWIQPRPGTVELRAFNMASWVQAAKSVGAYASERASCQLDRVRSWNGVASYSAKYLSKPHGLQFDFRTGRSWGFVNRALVPITEILQNFPAQVGKTARRILRKLQERRRRHWQFRSRPGSAWQFVNRQKVGNQLLSVDDSAAYLRDVGGFQIRLNRRRALHRKHVPIYAEIVEQTKWGNSIHVEQVDTETTDVCSSLFFLDDHQLAKLLAWAMAEADRRALFERDCPI